MEQTLVVLAPPLIFHQEVALENRLDHEVVFLVPLLQQSLLHYRQLGFIDADEAAFCFSDGHFLADLEVAVEQDLLTERPSNIDPSY